MANIEYVDVSREGMEDFADIIMPETFDALMDLEDLDDLGMVLIGAVDAGRPVGAIAVQLIEEGGIDILSLYVEPSSRRNGIGSELIKRVLSVGLEAFEPVELQETVGVDIPVKLTLHTEFAIEGAEHEEFLSFLKKNGFSEINDLGSFYTFDAQSLKALCGTVAGSDVISLEEAAAGHLDELSEAFEAKGLNTELKYCCIIGSFDRPDAMMLVEKSGENEFFVSSQVFGEEIDEDRYMSMIAKVAADMAEDNKDFHIIAGNEENAFPDIWDKFAASALTVAKHTSAQRFVMFTEE